MKYILSTSLLVACVTPSKESVELDIVPLSEALSYAQPEPLISLEEELRKFYLFHCFIVIKIDVRRSYYEEPLE